MRGGTLGDQVNAGPGRDVVTTGSGNDSPIRTQDGEVDRVSCGDGNFDRAIVDKKDIVSNDCEMTPGQ